MARRAHLAHTDANWVRAIWHGVRRGGTSLLVMPSETDLADLIAYLKQLS